jgi:hypothetical protein
VINKDGSSKTVSGETRPEFPRNNYAQVAPSSAPDSFNRTDRSTNQPTQSAPSSSEHVNMPRSKSFINNLPIQPASPLVTENIINEFEKQPTSFRVRERGASASSVLESASKYNVDKLPNVASRKLSEEIKPETEDDAVYVPTIYEKPNTQQPQRQQISLRRKATEPKKPTPLDDATPQTKSPFSFPKTVQPNPFTNINESSDSINELQIESPHGNVSSRKNPESVSRKVFHLEDKQNGEEKKEIPRTSRREEEKTNRRNGDESNIPTQRFGAKKFVQEEPPQESPIPTQRFGAKKFIPEEYEQSHQQERERPKEKPKQRNVPPPIREEYEEYQQPNFYKNSKPEPELQGQYSKQYPQQYGYAQEYQNYSPQNYQLPTRFMYENNQMMGYGMPFNPYMNQMPPQMQQQMPPQIQNQMGGPMNNFGGQMMNPYMQPQMQSPIPMQMQPNVMNQQYGNNHTALVNNFNSLMNGIQQQQNSYAKQNRIDEEQPTLYSSKRPRDVNFKPHGMADYKKIMSGINNMKLGGLGFAPDDPELMAKKEKLLRMKNYGREASMVNINKMTVASPGDESPREAPKPSRIPVLTQKKPSARDKALEFAKNVPKPKMKRTLDEEIAIEGEPEPMSEIEMFMMKHQQDNDWLKNAFH